MTPQPLRCVIATGNPHKAESIRRLLKDFPLELVDLSEFEAIQEPVEDGETFLENALIKSRYYSKMTGLVALADDSGLEVDALDGRPGIHSSRFAGVDSPHSEKMAKILSLLGDTPPEKRTARFRCVAAASFPDGRELHDEGAMEGVIGESPRGDGGFGYDPIVYLPEIGKTVAELTAKEKDERSHRAEAFLKLAKKLC
jgi:XTP/dITP diphosphohydrolase